VRRQFTILALLMMGFAVYGPEVRAQQVVDRMVARIDGDVLTWSEMRELASFQQLMGEKPASDPELIRQLVDQWMINTEARAEQFSPPSEAVVNRAMEELEKQVGSPVEFRRRLTEVGLTLAAVWRLLEQQMLTLQFLDRKFRGAAQVEPRQVETYYRDELVPQMSARGQQAPPIESVQERIRELLVLREISRLSARWLEESRSNLRIEVLEAKSRP